MPWLEFVPVAGVVVAIGTFGVVQIQRMRKADIDRIRAEIHQHFERQTAEMKHLTRTIEELKLADRCARREHQEIRREMMAEVSKIYQTLDQHKTWHLEQKG